MSPHLLILVIAVLGLALAAPKAREKTHNHCQSSRGVTFEDHQAVGTWTLLRLKTEKTNTVDNTNCIDLAPVSDKERQDLEGTIGQFVENLAWKNLTLKMLVPCASFNSSRSASYYLEKLDSDGSFRTLQLPPATAKLDLSSFHRYPVRLQLLEGRYLGMLDCIGRISFVMGRQPEHDPRLENLINEFWSSGK